MKKVKCLKDFGSWAKVGKIHILSDNMAWSMERKGVVKVIKDLGKFNQSSYFLRQSIKSAKQQIKDLQQRIKRYEKMLVKTFRKNGTKTEQEL